MRWRLWLCAAYAASVLVFVVYDIATSQSNDPQWFIKSNSPTARLARWLYVNTPPSEPGH